MDIFKALAVIEKWMSENEEQTVVWSGDEASTHVEIKHVNMYSDPVFNAYGSLSECLVKLAEWMGK